MSKAEYKVGKCNLCGRTDEGILFTRFWGLVKIFVCETCFSKLFKLFKKEKCSTLPK